MNGYLDPRAVASPAIVTVSGLPSSMSSGYDVYVYCFEDMTWGDTRTSKYTIGSTTHTVKQTEPPWSRLLRIHAGIRSRCGQLCRVYERERNQLHLEGHAGTSLHSTVRAPVNGIQIVYPSGS